MRERLYQLYRYFNKDEDLIYVGMTISAVRRMIEHKNGASWYPEVANMTVQNFPDRKALEIAEKLAIANEKPIHNKIRYSERPAGSTESVLAIKKNIRDAIELSGIPMKDIAEELCVNPSLIGHWANEKRTHLPTLASAVQFCEICGITPNDLFDEFKQPQQEAA